MNSIDLSKEFSYPLKTSSAEMDSADVQEAVKEYMTANPVSVPTKVSELENDSNFQTNADVNNMLTDYSGEHDASLKITDDENGNVAVVLQKGV